MAPIQTKRTARLEARISEEMKRRLEYAAALRGASLTDFVVQSAQEAALQTIREHATLSLNEEASRAFAELLLNPPEPNRIALAAADLYKARLDKDRVKV